MNGVRSNCLSRILFGGGYTGIVVINRSRASSLVQCLTCRLRFRLTRSPLTALLVCIGAWGRPACAQDLLFVQTPDSLVLQAGALIQVQGGVVLSGEGRILLEGRLVLGGGGTADWTDNNGLAGGVGGNGCVVLAAGGSEIGGAVTVELPTLRLATAGETYRLATSLSIRDSLLLGVGNALALEGHELQLLNADPGSLGWQAGGWIVSETHPDADPDYGTVRWEVAAGPSPPEYVIPFGVAGPELGVAFTPLSGSSSFHISTYGTGPDNLPLPAVGRDLPGPVTDLYSQSAGGDNAPWTLDRFWVMDPGENGSVVTLRYRAAESSGGVIGSEATLLAQPWVPGLGWVSPGLGSSDEPVTPTISFLAEAAGAWTLALGASPLPVSCQGLIVASLPAAVELQWSTESEFSNLGFFVQRRGDNSEWQTIGFVAGAGTSSQPHSYRFVDPHCPADGALYRLLQQDFNGSRHQACGVVHGRPLPDLLEPDEAITIWPNPSSDHFWVQAPALPLHSGEWLLFDGQGRLRGSGRATCANPPNTAVPDAQNQSMASKAFCFVQWPDHLPGGIYLFRWVSMPEQMFKLVHLPP